MANDDALEDLEYLRRASLYQRLALGVDVKPHQVRSAYLRLSRRFHPDKRPNDVNAPDRFVLIQEAYETLSNAARREEYDAQCVQAAMRSKAAAAGLRQRNASAKRSYADAAFADTAGDFYATSSNNGFKHSAAATAAAAAAALKPAPIEIEVEVPLAYVLYGGTLRNTYECVESVTCEGVRTKQAFVEVTLKACEPRYNLLRRVYAGIGDAGLRMARGDVHVRFKEREENDMWRDASNNVHKRVFITVYNMLTRSVFTVKYPEKPPTAPAESVVPEEVKVSLDGPLAPDTVHRMAGRGVFDPATGRRTDLFVHVHLVLPKRAVTEPDARRKLREALRSAEEATS